MDTKPPVAPAPSPLAIQPLAAILTFVLIIAVLYLGRGIFVPLVLAVLLAFALGPVVHAMRRVGTPHIVAVIVSVLAVIALISGVAYLAFSQMLSLASDLPRYQATISDKLRLLQETFGGGQVIDRLVATVERLGAQVEASAETLSDQGPEPIQVVIANDGMGALETAQALFFSIIGPLASVLIVTIFLIFLLLEREELRDRFLKLASRGDLRASTEAMNEASARVGRYLLAQATISAGYGALFGAGLFVLGVPNAILWGLLASVFRYIPFVGTLMIATIPILLSVAVDPGWTMLFGVIGLYVVLEIVSNNIIEPRLYGTSTGLTPLAVLVAAMFWATLWGPIGLIVSMPLTVCIVVMARYVPGLGFIETILGSAPVLLPQERLYQRLISANVEEAIELADREIEKDGISVFYEEIAVPALRLAEADIAGDLADPSHRHRVVETLAEVLDDIGDTATENGEDDARVRVFGGKTELDQAMALMVAERSRALGYAAQVMAPVALRKEGIAQMDLSQTDVVCLCYLGDKPDVYARYAARRLKRIRPELVVIAAYFHPDYQTRQAERTADEIDVVVHAIGSAELAIAQAVGGDERPLSDSPEVVPQLRVTARAITAQASADPDIARSLRRLARSANTTVAMVTVVPMTDSSFEESERSHAEHLAHEVLKRSGTLIIEDLQHSPYAKMRSVVESGVRAYAGVPIPLDDGHLGAVLAIYDQEPRLYDEAQIDLLEKAIAPIARETRQLVLRREAEEKEVID
ncbi:AI-2E family transporter [Pelagibacterium sp.]|uniref:AI-2E family transporter n=1 Tax=Pelagibacterium sp. TaxID=1967288 RepID=UPI003A9261B2